MKSSRLSKLAMRKVRGKVRTAPSKQLQNFKRGQLIKEITELFQNPKRELLGKFGFMVEIGGVVHVCAR